MADEPLRRIGAPTPPAVGEIAPANQPQRPPAPVVGPPRCPTRGAFGGEPCPGRLTDDPAIFGGIDIDHPLGGVSGMKKFLDHTSAVFTGFYLRPAWLAVAADLLKDWRVAPIFFGSQEAGQGSRDFSLRAAQTDAATAASDARTAGLALGSVIYLDWESGNAIPDPPLQYCREWFERLAEQGFRPGVYCAPANAGTFTETWPGLFVWIFQVGNRGAAFTSQTNPHPQTRAGFFGGYRCSECVEAAVLDLDAGRRPPIRWVTPDFAQSQFFDAWLWQWAQVQKSNTKEVDPATQKPFQLYPGANDLWPAAVTALIPDLTDTDLDLNAARTGDPAKPERLVVPQKVRGGRAAGVPGMIPTVCTVAAIRRGILGLVDWQPVGGNVEADDAPGGDLLLNPLAAIGAVAPYAEPDGACLVVLGRPKPPTPADSNWRLLVFRRQGGSWKLQTEAAKNTVESVKPDPLAGVSVVTRHGNAYSDLFVIGEDGSLYTAIFVPQRDWSELRPVQDPGGAKVALNPLSGIASVSRAPNFADVFVSDTQFHIRTAYSSAPQDWKGPIPFTDPAFELHPMTRLAAVSRAPDHLDVFVVGHYAGQDRHWQVHNLFWSQSDGWSHQVAGKTVYHVQPLFDGRFQPHPASGLAAVSSDSSPLEVFSVSHDDGQLYRTVWNAAAWSPWTLVAAAPYQTARGHGRIASIEAAVRRGKDDLDVLVTGRDNNLYATSRTGTSPFVGYTSFEPLRLH